MPARQKGEMRKQRWVGATDAEWAEICEGAQAAGLSNSDYVIRCCLDGKARADTTDVGLPAPAAAASGEGGVDPRRTAKGCVSRTTAR